MKIEPECIPCILKVVISAVRRLGASDAGEREMLGRVLDVPALHGSDWGKTAPEVVEEALLALRGFSNDPDPFRKVKVRQNEQALAILPWLRAEVARSANPLEMAARVAVVGNSIDLMTNPEGTVDVEQVVRERLMQPLPEAALEELERRLRSSRRVVYFGDNCGEVVFDRVLAECIGEETGAEVTYVVRSDPTLNDVTSLEAGEVGMEEVCRVVPNGIAGPFPGTTLSRCSPHVRSLVAEADLVISKGGGNFDSLDEEKSGRPSAFLLQTKCGAYQRRFGTQVEHPILHLVS